MRLVLAIFRRMCLIKLVRHFTCAHQIRVFGGSCLPPRRYCTLSPSTNLSSCTQLLIQEDTLSDLAKKTGGFALGALIGKGASKFSGLDIKRVYFGSAYWCRFLCQSSCRYLEIGSETTVRFVVHRRSARAIIIYTLHERLLTLQV